MHHVKVHRLTLGREKVTPPYSQTDFFLFTEKQTLTETTNNSGNLAIVMSICNHVSFVYINIYVIYCVIYIKVYLLYNMLRKY